MATLANAVDLRSILIGNVPISPPVAEIKTTNVLRDGSTVEVPSEVAHIVLARRNEKNQLQVEFVTGFGFPVKHSGYLYAENDDIESDSYLTSRWPHFSKVKPLWFRVAD